MIIGYEQINKQTNKHPKKNKQTPKQTKGKSNNLYANMYIGIKTFLEIFGNKLCKSLKSFLNKPEIENVLFPVTFLTWFQFNQGNLKYIEKKFLFFKAKLKHDCSKYE